MRISDWSSDVCSSDLRDAARITGRARCGRMDAARTYCCRCGGGMRRRTAKPADRDIDGRGLTDRLARHPLQGGKRGFEREVDLGLGFGCETRRRRRSEEHTSELQSLMRISYAVFCLKNKTTT